MKTLYLSLLIIICSSVISTQAVAQSVEQLHAEAEKIANTIQTEIGSATCDSDAQCKALPMGHRACGGPAYYLVYSTKVGDEDKLKSLANKHTAIHREINRINQTLSICEFLMPPPVSCIQGTCKAK
ncbi:MAG: hypothetical protein R3240_10685 [Gammaproteobacteria bacterium]|nr:hypothetical protein [Gammaproteobacteria bacterium]